MSSTVPRHEYEALERRVQKTEQALRQQDSQLKILQARLESLGAGVKPAMHVPVMDGNLDGRGRSRSPRGGLPMAFSQGLKVFTAEEFAQQNQLDEKCQEVLCNQPYEVQQYVINQGPADGRNPSAMVMSRIAKCTSEMGPVAPPNMDDKVEEFIGLNQLDDKCAEALRTQPLECQVAVIALGPAEGRNSSAMVMGRIAKFVRGNL